MKITLALGGGGAKGNAHIGALRCLEQEGFQIKSVAGTSFGGIIAVFYALGNTPTQIQAMLEAVDQTQLYGRDSQDGPALLGLAGVRKWLNDVVGEKTFQDLKIPCAVTAVNVANGCEVILAEGKLKDAILATIALPGIFTPARWCDMELIDGGVMNPVPVSVARMLSPDLPVVAVALNDPLDKPIRPYAIPVPSVLPRPIVEQISKMHFAQAYDIFMRGVDFSSRAVANLRLQLDAPDVIIRPDTHEVGLLDVVSVAEVARYGEIAAKEALPELRRAASWQYRLRKKFFGKKPCETLRPAAQEGLLP
ncbi:MAG: patatin-like phospholipase family protein [Anaerolineales bacterium]